VVEKIAELTPTPIKKTAIIIPIQIACLTILYAQIK